MFSFTIDPTFKHKFNFLLPGGKRVPVTIEFKYLDEDAAAKFFEGLIGKRDPEALAEIVAGWEGFGAAYSLDALKELCRQVPSAAAQFFGEWRGELFEARRKN